jgi:hypothetical protein
LPTDSFGETLNAFSLARLDALQPSGHNRWELRGTLFADSFGAMKWIDRARLKRAIGLGLLPLLLCFGSKIVCGQNVDLEESAVRRARQFEPIIVDAARKYGVNPHLLWVIAYLETRFDPNQQSRAGARGLMQFMPATASRYGLADPYDPIAAIEAAARYARDLAIRFDKRADLVLAAYNAGEEAVEAFLTGRTIKAGAKIINPKGIVTGGIPPYRETQRYVAQGLQLLERLSTTSFLTVSKPAPIDEAPAVTRAIIRKSIRVNSESRSMNNDQGRATSRRSIYFENRREQD